MLEEAARLTAPDGLEAEPELGAAPFAGWPSTSAFAHYETPDSAVCITLYNEPLRLLQKTMLSILQSVAHAQAQEQTGGVTCLCLIVDGADAADPDVLEWLERTGITTDCLGAGIGDEHLHFSSHCGRRLQRDLGAADADLRDVLHPVRVIACVKAANSGKLNSHSLFFRHLCRRLRPAFCFQLDTGTVVDESAYSTLMERMRREPDIGALAPCIMTSAPNDAAMFLSTWQYCDFVLQKSLAWPFEVAAGHLSVIPGQFCAFRWSALCSDEETRSQSKDPIEGYLRGLSTADPLEKIMFLAEDRVIGNEIVLREGSNWRLKYSPDAGAVTDACVSVRELMRQRRRWNNSAFACRIWLLGRVPAYVARHDRSAIEKLRFSVAILHQLLLMLLEFGAPAVTFATLAAFVEVAMAATSPDAAAARIIVFGSMLGLIALPLLRRVLPAMRASRLFAVVRSLLSVALSVAMFVVLATTLPSAALLLMCVPAALVAIAIALLDWRHIVKLLLWQNIYLLANLLLSPLLTTYAVLNLHDVSWGTKGLTRSSVEARLGERMKTLRGRVVLCWFGANLGLGALALMGAGLTSQRLNLVFEATCFIGSVTALVSVAHLSWLRLTQKLGKIRAAAAGRERSSATLPLKAEA